jgi:hypothetical protein
MVKARGGTPRCRLAIASTMLESSPPDRYDTTGTSARSRRSTACSKRCSSSSTSFVGDSEPSSLPESGKLICQ